MSSKDTRLHPFNQLKKRFAEARDPFPSPHGLFLAFPAAGFMPTFQDGMAITIDAFAFGGAVAAVFALLASRKQATRLSQDLARAKSRITALELADENFRSVISLEDQCLIRWRDGAPGVIAHTLSGSTGVPSKLGNLLRPGSWLDGEDQNHVHACLVALRRAGTPFSLTATTVEGQVVEIDGRICDADPIVRIRAFSPVNKEMVRLIGENRRLSRTIEDLNTLFDGLPIPVWRRDNKDNLVWVNKAYADAVQCKDAAQVVEDQAELLEARHRVSLRRTPAGNANDRHRLRTVVNGSLRLFEAIAVPFQRGASGGAAIDVAPLDSVESELGRQTADHVKTLDRVSTGIAIFSPGRRMTYVNDAFISILHLEQATSLNGRSFGELLDLARQHNVIPDQSIYRKWRNERIAAFDQGRTLDEYWHGADSRTLHVLTEHRQDGGATLFVNDVTEKVALERRFHDVMEAQRETLDNLSEGIAVFGSDGRLRLHNPAFGALWGFAGHVLGGNPHIRDLVRHLKNHEREKRVWETMYQEATALTDGREPFSGVLNRDDARHLAYAGTPLPDGGTLLTFTDITDSKRIEVVLMEKNEALEASDRLKTAFLSHVSYELRTPLTSIIGFADLLAEPVMGPLTERQRDYLNDIRTSSQALKTIINDILDLAVIDAGGLDLKLKPVSIKSIVDGAELAVRDRLAKNKLSLDVHIAKGVETVTADSRRMIQVLYNLLSNAISFSPEGSTITLGCRREKNGIVFSVQDRGAGIPEEEQASVFDRFEARSKGSRHRGAGLGLSLVKSLVELHNGVLKLRSTPGAGTTVSIFLPDQHLELGATHGVKELSAGFDATSSTAS